MRGARQGLWGCEHKALLNQCIEDGLGSALLQGCKSVRDDSLTGSMFVSIKQRERERGVGERCYWGGGRKAAGTVLVGFCTTAHVMGMARGAGVLHMGFSPVFGCLNLLCGISNAPKHSMAVFNDHKTAELLKISCLTPPASKRGPPGPPTTPPSPCSCTSSATLSCWNNFIAWTASPPLCTCN